MRALPTTAAHRKACRAAVDCPECGAGKRKRCVKIVKRPFIAGEQPWIDETEALDYVHDDRSASYDAPRNDQLQNERSVMGNVASELFKDLVRKQSLKDWNIHDWRKAALGFRAAATAISNNGKSLGSYFVDKTAPWLDASQPGDDPEHVIIPDDMACCAMGALMVGFASSRVICTQTFAQIVMRVMRNDAKFAEALRDATNDVEDGEAVTPVGIVQVWSDHYARTEFTVAAAFMSAATLCDQRAAAIATAQREADERARATGQPVATNG